MPSQTRFWAVAALVALAIASHARPQATRPEDLQRTIREQVYVLRNNSVWVKSEETYAAARRLIAIGKPAVPELRAELERDPGDQATRVLAFTLRNISDPRAVPTLINALGRTRFMASDCGDRIYDRDLWEFVRTHSISHTDDFPEFTVARADREIIGALKALTGYSVSDAFNYAPRNDRPRLLEAVKNRREADMELWRQWWTGHSADLVKPAEMALIKPPVAGEDPVGQAGAAKFGPLFPVGQAARLGPVHEMFLEQKGTWDTRGYLDLDTGRTYANFERIAASPERPQMEYITSWYRTMGVDATISFGLMNADSKNPANPPREVYDLKGEDMRAWQIANDRWDTLDAEIAAGKPLDLGKAHPRDQLYNMDLETGKYADQSQFPRTFLVLTREGGQGILQIVDSSEKPPGVKLRYRMWEGIASAKIVLPPAFVAPQGLKFGEVKTLKLPSPASGEPCCVDLDTGVIKPLDGRPQELITVEQQQAAAKTGGDAVPQPQKEGKLWVLTGLDMVAGSVGADAWEYFTTGEVQEVLSRCYKDPSNRAFMKIPGTHYSIDTGTYVFRTREGAMGLLQVLEGTDNLPTLSFRYKLVKGP